MIEHVPRLDVATLLSNFGGQLGLMAGVSAISIVELTLWMLLIIFDRLYVLYDRFVLGG